MANIAKAKELVSKLLEGADYNKRFSDDDLDTLWEIKK